MRESHPKKIFICSPYAGNIEVNISRASAYARKIALEGNIPIAPHLYFTRFLDDESAKERELGLNYALALLEDCDEMHVLGDHISKGMKLEIDHWKSLGRQPKEMA